MKTNLYKQPFWEFGHCFLQIASCCLLGEVFLGFMETFLKGLVPSSHISLERIHRFSSSVETKEQPLFQSNISLDPNFEVKITLKYIYVGLA